MSPFGPMHHQPVFLTDNVQDTGYCRLLKDKHLKLTLSDGTATMQAIAFDMPEYFERIKKGHKFSVCYTLEENTFRDITTLQLMIKDIKFEE